MTERTARTRDADASPGEVDEAKPTPVRALFINDTSRNGGPGRTLSYILTFLDSAAVYRTVMVPREGAVTDLLRKADAVEEIFLQPNFIENIVEPWSRAIVRGDFDASVAFRAVRAVGNVGRAASAMASLAARIRRDRFDVLFCNGTSANFAGAALAAVTGVPAIWHVFYSSLPQPIEGLHGRLAASRGVASILCVSKPTARLFDRCPNKVRIVGDSIDCDEYDVANVEPRLRAELGLAAGTVVIGSQGRILPRKGFAHMVRAARLAVDAMTAAERARCRFVVYGDTPEDLRPNHLEECRALVTELNLGGMFLFPGHRADTKPYLADFDVAVVPSVYEDPLPRTVIEAMALGKPVVAFAVGGIPELVQSGVTGALVASSPPDVAELARAMLAYARDPDLRRHHGAAGRAYAREHLDARAHARIIEREIVSVARGRTRGESAPRGARE
jgi:glycosyltransferase involved in cell wall biosynthesis